LRAATVARTLRAMSAPASATVERAKPHRFKRGHKPAGNRPEGFKQPNQHSDLGPHSRVRPLAKVDMRTSEGLVVHRLRRQLIAHCGGNPSIVQMTIIERCCWLQLRLALLDKKILGGHEWTEYDNNSYLSWSNALVRTMSRLGFEPKKSNGSTPLGKVLAEMRS